MAVEKEITENQDEEIKVEEEQNTPTIPEILKLKAKSLLKNQLPMTLAQI